MRVIWTNPRNDQIRLSLQAKPKPQIICKLLKIFSKTADVLLSLSRPMSRDQLVQSLQDVSGLHAEFSVRGFLIENTIVV